MSEKGNIGYRHPPEKHRFPKGRSGNPNGRPRGARNLRTVLEQALLAPARSLLDGSQKTVAECAVDALAYQICNNPNPSSVAAASKVLNLAMSLCPRQADGADKTGKNTGNGAPSPPETGQSEE